MAKKSSPLCILHQASWATLPLFNAAITPRSQKHEQFIVDFEKTHPFETGDSKVLADVYHWLNRGSGALGGSSFSGLTLETSYTLHTVLWCLQGCWFLLFYLFLALFSVRVSPCAHNLTCTMPGVPSSKGCEACRKTKKKVFALFLSENCWISMLRNIVRRTTTLLTVPPAATTLWRKRATTLYIQECQIDTKPQSQKEGNSSSIEVEYHFTSSLQSTSQSVH